MNKTMKLALTVTLAAATLSQLAFAETVSFSGKVGVSKTQVVYAPIGGTVSEVCVTAGQGVSAEDPVALLKTTKVYADKAGVISGIFAQPGDSAETVASTYGAVMYIEDETKYTISASTDSAYSSTATTFVHVGESLYIKSRSDSSRTGTGIVSSVQGTSYEVKVTSGSFIIGESTYLYRDDTYKSSVRVGGGSIARNNPVSVTGSGSIVSIAVQDGDTVQRGDLLFETLDGSFDGLYMSGAEIPAGVDGVIAKVDLQQGSNVQKDSAVATIYPTDSMRIEAELDEEDLGLVHVGDPVSIELTWNGDKDITYDGTVTMISAIATESSVNSADASGSNSVTYTVYIDFNADSDTRYGMSAVVNTLEADEDENIENDTEADEEA